MTIKKIFIILVASCIQIYASQENTYDLSKIYIQNFNFVATIRTIPKYQNLPARNLWVSKNQILGEEKVNGIPCTKIKNTDYEGNIEMEVEYTCIDKKGIIIEYNDSKIKKGTNYKAMPLKAKIGDSGILPTLYYKNGKKLSSSWKLLKQKNQTIFRHIDKYKDIHNSIIEVNIYNYVINNKSKVLDFYFNFYQGNKQLHLLKVNKKEITYN
ncbi:hypothetical protein ACMC56_16125 [Campylobacterota bacterium DY0563]